MAKARTRAKKEPAAEAEKELPAVVVEKWVPSPAELVEIEGMAARGLSDEQIIGALGFPPRQAKEKLQIEAVADRIAIGRSKGVLIAANILFEKMSKGDVAAAKFYLERIAKWKSETVIDTTSNITVKLVRPEMMPMEDWQRAAEKHRLEKEQAARLLEAQENEIVDVTANTLHVVD